MIVSFASNHGKNSQRISALLLGLGIGLLAILLLRGNQQIVATPLSLWAVLLTWPVNDMRVSVEKRKKSWLFSKGILVVGIALATWSCAIIMGWPLVHSSRDGADLAVAQIKRAEELVKEGRLEDGLALLQRVNVPPERPIENARKHHDLGVILIQLHRADMAVEHLLLSLKYDRANAQAAYLLAVLAAGKGRTDEAKAMADMALTIQPEFEPAMRLRQRLETTAGTIRNEGR